MSGLIPHLCGEILYYSYSRYIREKNQLVLRWFFKGPASSWRMLDKIKSSDQESPCSLL